MQRPVLAVASGSNASLVRHTYPQDVIHYPEEKATT